MNRQISVLEAAAVIVVVLAILAASTVFRNIGPVPLHVAKSAACMSNLKQLALAADSYAGDNDGRLPPRDKWLDEVVPYGNLKHLQCPELKEGEGVGYAFNSRLDSAKRTAISSPARTPLFYDSTNLARNASDPVTSLPRKPRHQGRFNIVAFADGHARSVRSPQSKSAD